MIKLISLDLDGTLLDRAAGAGSLLVREGGGV